MRALSLIAALVVIATGAAAGPLEDGIAAYNRGDPKTALKLWQPLADAGNPDAQVNIGVLHANGEGVVTGKLLYALFQHDTSRALDPQGHIHAVIANLTRMPGGKWQALHADTLRTAIEDLQMLDRGDASDYSGILTMTDKVINLLVAFDSDEREAAGGHPAPSGSTRHDGAGLVAIAEHTPGVGHRPEA